MDFSERLRHRLPQILRALHAGLARFFRACVVERFRSDRIGETGDRASIIDLCLRAFRFQLVQNGRELRDLLFSKIELVSQKTERTTNAQTAAAAMITESAITESTGPRVLAKMLDERISAERTRSVCVPMAVIAVMPMTTAMTSVSTFVRAVASFSALAKM